jgi:hypothetical protein
MDLSQIADVAKRELSTVTGLKPSTIVGISQEGNEWVVQVEMVEKESIPSGMDLLGTYEVRINGSGEVINFNRIRLRKRIDTSEGG